MSVKNDAGKRSGFLSSLLRNQSGNVSAIFAAAIFPVAGLVGGAVDMARVYSVKTRLQAACDAGSLAARKVMGNGRWDTNNDGNVTNDPTHAAGLQMFDLNFENGFIGTGIRTRTFTQANGTVTGTASAQVPMTLMKIMGQETRNVAVTCTSQMKIPHSDVMFVFDVTGSMAQTIPGDPSGLTKINGLKLATKCFYEALARQNITDISPGQCKAGATQNPIGDLSTLTQLRFGFVPFDEQVNVGRLLPNGYFANNQNMQSRRPTNLATVQTYTLDTATGITGWLNNWSPAAPPTSPYHTRESDSSWTDITSGSTTTLQGSKSFQISAATSTNCASGNNTLSGSGSQLAGLTEVGGTAVNNPLGTTNSTPVHPAAEQVTTYNQTRPFTVTQYRYIWEKRGGTTSCFLERRAHSTPYNKTQTGGQSTRSITWTPRQRITGGWTYTSVNFDVSALKGGGGNDASLLYNSSLSLPLNESSLTVKLSGQTSDTTIKIISNASVAWTGCIEEAQTVQTNDWDPIDTTTAFDMNVDLVPDVNDDATRWKFQLSNAAWGRHNGVWFDGDNDGDAGDGSDYFEAVTADIVRSDTSGMSRNTSPGCPKAASKLTIYRDAAGATLFQNYVNALAPTGNTYHDIGLLWGARLMSPTGIFASLNATTPTGAEIQRHMIFMTDGETFNVGNNYTPYGLEAWDRRRTPTDTHPTWTSLTDATDARTVALCTAIKNLGNTGVTLWVVYYGTTDATTTARMTNCATSPAHFFPATDTPKLIESFNKIAESISELKLTG